MAGDQRKADPKEIAGPAAPVSPRAPSWLDCEAESSKNSETPEKVTAETATPKSKPKRKRGIFAWIAVILFDAVILAAILCVLAFVLLAGRELPAPQWIASRVEARMNEDLGASNIALGGIGVVLERNGSLKVAFKDVLFLNAEDAELASVPAMEVQLDKSSFLAGAIQPRAIELAGAELQLRRDADGSFDLALGGDLAQGDNPENLGAVIDAVDALLEQPGFAPIEEITARSLSLVYNDERSKRRWVIDDGRIVMNQSESEVSIQLRLPLAAQVPQDAPKELRVAALPVGQVSLVSLGLTSAKGSSRAEVRAQISNVAAKDIAAQSPIFAFLSLLDAPLSGALRTQIETDGQLGDVAGLLEIGTGRLTTQVQPIPVQFSSGRSYFRYDPKLRKITFDELKLDTDQVAMDASGHAYLEGIEQGLPSALITQLQFSAVRLDMTGMFAQAAAFDTGSVDAKLVLDPFQAQIGQLVLTGPNARVAATGRVDARPDGWYSALDLDIAQIDYAPLLQLWPIRVAPRTRTWLLENVSKGTVFDARGAIRKTPLDEKPLFSAVLEFEDAEVRVLKSMPPIQGARGYASLNGDAFSLSLDAGRAKADKGGIVDFAGTVVTMPNLRVRPVQAEVKLKSDSSITAALSMLDRPPFKFVSNAGEPVDLAEGRAIANGVLNFPLQQKIPRDAIRFDVKAKLRNVRSKKVVPGYDLRGDGFELRAKNGELQIAGNGTIAGVPVRATFVQPLRKGAVAEVEGTIELSQKFIDAFNIGLPKGMISGAGTGNYAIKLPAGQAPSFTLRSDLNRMGIRIAELAWSKAKATRGSLVVTGGLGGVPRIDSLKMKAAGLTADGTVTLNTGGGLKEARFRRVAVGGWIDAPVTLVGRGKGVSPAVVVRGGTVDVRKTSFAQGGNGGPAGGPISLALDRLTISEGITLRNFKAKLTQKGGLSGNFTGSVNGEAPISGTLVPSSEGTAVRIKSKDAGRVIRAAGLFKKGKGGDMTLILVPRKSPGQYNGTLKVKSVRVQSAPGLSALLNAISVVGLLEQLNGAGLLLANVDAEFVLTPTYVQVDKASGTGPSLGISMAGVYDMGRDRLKMQGVFSPIYVVNGIGQLFSKKGEGLFGFNYAMTGPTSNPKVSVNPLSVLTPGMFREIFRRPPPKVTE